VTSFCCRLLSRSMDEHELFLPMSHKICSKMTGTILLVILQNIIDHLKIFIMFQ